MGFGFKVKLSASDLGLGFQCRAGCSGLRSCWAGSYPPSRTTEPCHNLSREELLVCPRPHSFSASVAYRDLRISSSSHFKAAAVRKTAKGGVGRATFFSESWAEWGEGKRRNCWDGSHSPSPNYDTVPKHFLHKEFRVARAAWNRSMNLRSSEALGSLRSIKSRLQHWAEHLSTLQAATQHFANTLPARSTSFGQGNA